jgi:hypothetical protein
LIPITPPVKNFRAHGTLPGRLDSHRAFNAQRGSMNTSFGRELALRMHADLTSRHFTDPLIPLGLKLHLERLRLMEALRDKATAPRAHHDSREIEACEPTPA